MKVVKRSKEKRQDQNKTRKNNTNMQQWLTKRNKNKRDKYGHILGEVEKENENEVDISNSFDALKDEDDDNSNELEKEHNKESTRGWVNKSFGKTKEITQSSNVAKDEVIVQESDKSSYNKEVSQESKVDGEKDNQQGMNAQKKEGIQEAVG